MIYHKHLKQILGIVYQQPEITNIDIGYVKHKKMTSVKYLKKSPEALKYKILV